MKLSALRKLFVAAILLPFAAIGMSGSSNAATGPSMPWEHTTSSNTDPRLGLVAVDGPEEEGKFIAGCTGTTLWQGRVAQQPGDAVFSLEEVPFSFACQPGDVVVSAATQGSPRIINTDYQSGWVVRPVPAYGPPSEDGTMPVEFIGLACSGTTGIMFTLTGGFPDWELMSDVRECGATGNGLVL